PQPDLKLTNPFEEEEPETQASSFVPEEKPRQAPATEETGEPQANTDVSPSPPGASIVDNPFEEQEDTDKHQRIARGARRKQEPRSANEQEQTEVLQDLGFFRSEASVEEPASLGSAEPADGKHVPADVEVIVPARAQPSAVANPFDVQSDL